MSTIEELNRAALKGDEEADYKLVAEYMKLEDYPNAVKRLGQILAAPSHSAYEKAALFLAGLSQDDCFKIAEALYAKRMYKDAAIYYKKTINKHDSNSENSLKMKKKAEDAILAVSLNEKEERERKNREHRKVAAARRIRAFGTIIAGGLFLLVLFFVFVYDSNQAELPNGGAETTEEDENPQFVTIGEKEYDVNLTSLYIEWTELTASDVEQLAYMKNLVKLELKMCQIRDISALAELKNLEQLDLRFNEISDIRPLANLTNLTYLNLNYNNITDISALAGLINLTELDVANNFLTDLSPLYGNLTKLENLYIYGNDRNDPESPLDEYVHGAAIRARFPGCTVHF